MMMEDMAENPPSPEELKVSSPAILLPVFIYIYHEGCNVLDKGTGTLL